MSQIPTPTSSRNWLQRRLDEDTAETNARAAARRSARVQKRVQRRTDAHIKRRELRHSLFSRAKVTRDVQHEGGWTAHYHDGVITGWTLKRSNGTLQHFDAARQIHLSTDFKHYSETYDAKGTVTSRKYATGVVEQFKNGRVDTRTWPGGDGVVHRNIYDNDNVLTGVEATLPNGDIELRDAANMDVRIRTERDGTVWTQTKSGPGKSVSADGKVEIDWDPKEGIPTQVVRRREIHVGAGESLELLTTETYEGSELALLAEERFIEGKVLTFTTTFKDKVRISQTIAEGDTVTRTLFYENGEAVRVERADKTIEHWKNYQKQSVDYPDGTKEIFDAEGWSRKIDADGHVFERSYFQNTLGPVTESLVDGVVVKRRYADPESSLGQVTEIFDAAGRPVSRWVKHPGLSVVVETFEHTEASSEMIRESNELYAEAAERKHEEYLTAVLGEDEEQILGRAENIDEVSPLRSEADELFEGKYVDPESVLVDSGASVEEIEAQAYTNQERIAAAVRAVAKATERATYTPRGFESEELTVAEAELKAAEAEATEIEAAWEEAAEAAGMVEDTQGYWHYLDDAGDSAKWASAQFNVLDEEPRDRVISENVEQWKKETPLRDLERLVNKYEPFVDKDLSEQAVARLDLDLSLHQIAHGDLEYLDGELLAAREAIEARGKVFDEESAAAELCLNYDALTGRDTSAEGLARKEELIDRTKHNHQDDKAKKEIAQAALDEKREVLVAQAYDDVWTGVLDPSVSQEAVAEVQEFRNEYQVVEISEALGPEPDAEKEPVKFAQWHRLNRSISPSYARSMGAVLAR